MRMRRVILLSVACPVLPYSATLSHKRHDFGGKKQLLNTKCVLIICTTSSETSHSKKTSAIYNQLSYAISRTLLEMNAMPHVTHRERLQSYTFRNTRLPNMLHNTHDIVRQQRKDERVRSLLLTLTFISSCISITLVCLVKHARP
jgi:hypothetical protein